MRPEMQFCFAVKTTLLTLVSLREKWHEIHFCFDLLIFYLCLDEIIACPDHAQGSPSTTPKTGLSPNLPLILNFSFHTIFDHFAQTIFPLPLVEPKWETLGTVYIARIPRNENNHKEITTTMTFILAYLM